MCQPSSSSISHDCCRNFVSSSASREGGGKRGSPGVKVVKQSRQLPLPSCHDMQLACRNCQDLGRLCKVYCIEYWSANFVFLWAIMWTPLKPNLIRYTYIFKCKVTYFPCHSTKYLQKSLIEFCVKRDFLSICCVTNWITRNHWTFRG